MIIRKAKSTEAMHQHYWNVHLKLPERDDAINCSWKPVLTKKVP